MRRSAKLRHSKQLLKNIHPILVTQWDDIIWNAMHTSPADSAENMLQYTNYQLRIRLRYAICFRSVPQQFHTTTVLRQITEINNTMSKRCTVLPLLPLLPPVSDYYDTITIGGTAIQVSTEAVCLGVLLDSALTFAPHVRRYSYSYWCFTSLNIAQMISDNGDRPVYTITL